MPTTLLFTLLLMLLVPFIARKFITLPRNVIILFWVQPLALAPTSVIVLVGGLVSVKIAPDPTLATLPLTLMIIGTALSTIPASFTLKKLGRKNGSFLGLSLSLIGSLLGMFAIQNALFSLLLIAAFLIGISMAFVLQLRFAAMESVDSEKDVANVLSFLMVGGIFSAFLGPEIAVLAKDWIQAPFGYAGSFLGLALLNVIALLIFTKFRETPLETEQQQSGQRPLATILRQPTFIIAALSAAVAYGIMSFVMTATPLSMHEMSGHSLDDTKWVIQSHIAAMYLPSLFVGGLINRFGLKIILFSGALIYAFMVFIALLGQHLLHYWWALVLLGIGWNFLFTGGTVLLTGSYKAGEKFKVQAINDFIVFATQAAASISAGWLLFKFGWDVIAYTTIPAITVMILALIWFYRTNEQGVLK